jgi:hypothetical protein
MVHCMEDRRWKNLTIPTLATSPGKRSQVVGSENGFSNTANYERKLGCGGPGWLFWDEGAGESTQVGRRIIIPRVFPHLFVHLHLTECGLCCFAVFPEPSTGDTRKMWIHFLGILLFFFATIARGDKFIFPPDGSIPSPTPYHVFPWGESQQITWTASVSSVTLSIFQAETDDQDIICSKCSKQFFSLSSLLIRMVFR